MSDIKLKIPSDGIEEIDTAEEDSGEIVILAGGFHKESDKLDDVIDTISAPSFEALLEKVGKLSNKYPTIDEPLLFESRIIPVEITQVEEIQVSDAFKRRVYKSGTGKIVAEQG
jgi:hypothetical protein